MSLRRTAAKIVLALAVLAVLAPSAFSASQQAATQHHKFHAHVDAYSYPRGCRQFEWNSPSAVCLGTSNNGNNGTANGLHGTVRVDWCPVGSCNPVDYGAHHRAGGYTAPHGYTRWMILCSRPAPTSWDPCRNWILGAVKMPNGPFAVVGGGIDGHAVTPTSSDESKVEHQGGPLFLYVGFHGEQRVSEGSAPGAPFMNNGYVFGFRGWLNY